MPKAWVASAVFNSGEERNPTIRGDVTAALFAMENADVAIGDKPLACLTSPFQSAIRCGLAFDADETVAANAVNMERHF